WRGYPSRTQTSAESGRPHSSASHLSPPCRSGIGRSPSCPPPQSVAHAFWSRHRTEPYERFSNSVVGSPSARHCQCLSASILLRIAEVSTASDEPQRRTCL